MKTMPEILKIIQGLAPASDAAGRAGDIVSLKNANQAYVVVNITQGNAATIQLDVQQAASVSGATKALPAMPIWSNLDAAASDTLVRRTDAVNYTTDAGVKNKVVVFRIDPAALDTANNYDCINVVTGASHADNITAAMYYLDLKYKEASPASAIID